MIRAALILALKSACLTKEMDVSSFRQMRVTLVSLPRARPPSRGWLLSFVASAQKHLRSALHHSHFPHEGGRFSSIPPETLKESRRAQLVYAISKQVQKQIRR